MQIIAVANQKGGVGKTTTSTVLASGLYSKGNRVLLCDLDPQTNASFMTGVDVLSVANLYDVFKGEKTVGETIVPVRLGFDLLPGSLLLAAADSEFTQTGREYMLKEALDSIKEQYDYIVINDQLEECVKELHAIIGAAHNTPFRNEEFINNMREELKTV